MVLEFQAKLSRPGRDDERRGISLAHTTILRWVQHYSPEFERRWKRYARSVGGSWRMDETYVRVKGEWMYLYRAVDQAGKTVDFFLSRTRDVNAAKAFLRKAMTGQRIPTKITLDAYAASHRAVTELKDSGELPNRLLFFMRAPFARIVYVFGKPVSSRFSATEGDIVMPDILTRLGQVGARAISRRRPGSQSTVLERLTQARR